VYAVYVSLYPVSRMWITKQLITVRHHAKRQSMLTQSMLCFFCYIWSETNGSKIPIARTLAVSAPPLLFQPCPAHIYLTLSDMSLENSIANICRAWTAIACRDGGRDGRTATSAAQRPAIGIFDLFVPLQM
jgi:hypothetical protein